MNFKKPLLLAVTALTVGFAAKAQKSKPEVTAVQLYSFNQGTSFAALLPDSMTVQNTDSTTKNIALGQNQAMVLDFSAPGGGISGERFPYKRHRGTDKDQLEIDLNDAKLMILIDSRSKVPSRGNVAAYKAIITPEDAQKLYPTERLNP